MKGRIVKSVFIGGGTPSLLPAEHIERVMRAVYDNFEVKDGAEISIECNPGSLVREKIEAYRGVGINRVSMGLQSTDEGRLVELGRIHTFDEFEGNFKLLREMGFENINVDLMFGLPGQTILDWERTLEQVIALGPEHISVYGLIIEEGTPFYERWEKDALELPDEELEREMYWVANEQLNKHGYEHYEISNYSKSGMACRHNKVYWELGDYIGMGIGAASYVDGVRKENLRDLEGYIAAKGDLREIVVSEHRSTVFEEQEEFIFLGLRLMKGISKKEYAFRFKESIEDRYLEVLMGLKEEMLLVEEGDLLKLSSRGIDISNYVFAKFLNE